MKLDEIVASLNDVEARIDTANAVLKALSQEKAQIKRDLQDAMTEVGVPDFKAHGLHVKLEVSESPKAEDWDAFYDYIHNTNRPWLLHKRLSSTALKELRDGGEAIPGIVWQEFADVSITKVRR